MRQHLPGLLLAVAFIQAHEQPASLVVFDVTPHQVVLTLHLPLSELELARGRALPRTGWEPALRPYLLQHIRPSTGANPWTVQVMEMHLAPSDREAVVSLSLTPPTGFGQRDFTLHYDVILHQVVTHKALVSLRNDWERAQTEREPSQIGVIRVNNETARIDPLEIHLGRGSWWAGFQGMVLLGIQHIKEGTDHLLFLLVLLLPAGLLVSGRQWGEFGGSRYSLLRLLKIVTAFTAGHSITLLAGALRWLQMPQQPVEVLIAISILVSAIHAIRPMFAGREAYVAAGFGLIHGLAFATVLADMQLGASPLALSILGFNLGIELMQLFVIAVTMPWLIVLSLTPAYPSVRVTSAVLAGIAAVGWIAHRVSGESNFIERSMQAVSEFAPVGILLLAAIAVPAYLLSPLRQIKISPQTES